MSKISLSTAFSTASHTTVFPPADPVCFLNMLLLSMYIVVMNSGHFISFSLRCFTATALLIGGCAPPVQSPGNASYASAHFTLYFYEDEYTLAEIENIALTKEMLLEHVNRSLDASFSGSIDCYLFKNPPGHAWASYNGMIFEPRDYVLSDPGHEIVHVVVYATLGTTPNHFMAEGMAEAIQLDYYHPAERYALLCPASGDSLTESIYIDLFENTFDYSACSYYRAGAFVDYCISVAGLGAVKALYEASRHESGTALYTSFVTIFNSSPYRFIADFADRYFSEVSTSDTLRARTASP